MLQSDLGEGTKRAAILRDDARHVWRPYTATADQARMDALVFASSDGVYLVDEDGRRFLDGNSSWWTMALGHGHPRLRRALVNQAERMMHVPMAGATHGVAADLARALVAVCPGDLSRVFFSDDGSTAVETAIKMAIQYHQQTGQPGRTTFVPLPGSFHGDTTGAMSLGGVDAFHDTFRRITFSTLRAREPEGQDWSGTLEHMEQLFSQHGSRVAALVVEPGVQGAVGMRFVPDTVLREVVAMARRAGSLVIADEVFSGYGRTGCMWAVERARVEPDILCTAKGFSGGVMPFAATVASDRVFSGFDGDKTRALMHGHTFCGNPLGAAVALEVLRIFEDEDVLAQLEPKSRILSRGMARATSLAPVKDVRVLGMVAACEVGDPCGYGGTLGWEVYREALARGLYARPLGNTVYLTPPLNAPDGDLSRMVDVLVESIAAVATGRPNNAGGA